jgi:hypothetical protein
VARNVKLAAVSGVVAALGLFALLARATHPGSSGRSSAAPAALAAPNSFVGALDRGLSPGVIGPAGGPAQAQTRSS